MEFNFDQFSTSIVIDFDSAGWILWPSGQEA